MTTPRFSAATAALLAGLAVPLFLVGPTPAYAADDELRWAVQPSSAQGPGERSQFGYDLAPGQHLDDRVAITNLSRRPLTFTVYATDAATTADGSFTLLPASQPATDAGGWIGLPRKQHTVGPGQRIVLPFRLTVPANATAGDHAAGILASVAQRGADGQGQQVTVDRRVAARVYLRVTGPVRPAVQITTVRTAFANPLLPFARGPMSVTYRVRNTGNVRVTGTLSVRATGLFGVPLSGTGRRQLPDLLPGAEVELAQRVDGTFPAGMVTGSVTLTAADSAGQLPTQTRSAAVWTVPWTFVLLLGLPAVLAAVRVRRRRRAVASAGAVPAEPTGDGASGGGASAAGAGASGGGVRADRDPVAAN